MDDPQFFGAGRLRLVVDIGFGGAPVPALKEMDLPAPCLSTSPLSLQRPPHIEAKLLYVAIQLDDPGPHALVTTRNGLPRTADAHPHRARLAYLFSQFAPANILSKKIKRGADRLIRRIVSGVSVIFGNS